ncbi:hypothetical protein [Dechloromonas sp. H13]|uniref:hypothetical protein n=1 Tax=Dechloromonas sp. H13 TaxID=2570193 RepID=UPI0012923645|nr:hypothetical protein [Dechloromonas sp. H13]
MNASTRPKPFCFVLMPFDRKFDDVYEFGIRGACEDASVYCERVDEQIFPGSMLDRIYNQISTADLLVADMTGRNPNVFYEVGYAHSQGKNVILLTQQADDIPFDLRHFPHVVYGGQIKDLRRELAPRVKHFAYEAIDGELEQIGLEVFVGNVSLDQDGLEVAVPASNPRLSLTVFNRSTKTYESDDYSVAVIAPFPWDKPYYLGLTLSNASTLVSELPDGRYLHRLTVPAKLFPGDFGTVTFGLDSSLPVSRNAQSQAFPLVIRIYTASGSRDFHLSFQLVKDLEQSG